MNGVKKNKKHAQYEDDLQNFSVKGNSKIDNGLVSSRGMTDCLCLLVFIGFFVALVFIVLYSITYGKLRDLVAPVDADLKMCGIDEPVKEYTYLYLDDINAAAENNVIGFLNSGICVKTCP